ncbi:MAG: hypothetical protein DLM50_05970 [Candidatus Meridianibacter frigidus]|nr:MAG: hypothetical protein DLM50_05970 [Candidatus Eremiobacteraeota bacterium]
MNFTRAAALWLSAVILLAGCTRVQSVGTTGRRPWTQPHVLRIADISDPDHFNPLLSTMDLVYDLDALVFSFLIIADDKGELIGDLATEVPSLSNGGVSADGRRYTYHLHRGVKWHDGARFTARDVKFTWQAVMNPNNNTLHREGYDQVSSIDTPDDQSVIVHLKRRYPPFVTKFFTSLQEGGKGLLPAHLLARLHDINQVPFNAHPVGTGPFRFSSWDRGRRVVFVRNDSYFKGRPKLAKIILNVISDDNTLLTAVRTHDVDLIVSPPSSLYDRYRKLEDTYVALAPWNAQALLIMNQRRPQLADLNVRKAVTMAIDYQAFIDKISHGVGQQAHDIVPPVAVGYTENPPYAYDPVSANTLLDRSGWKRGPDGVRQRNGQRLDFVIEVSVGSTGSLRIATYLQQMFKAVGMNLAIKTSPYNVIFSHEGPLYGGRYDFATYSTTLPWDPDNLFYLGCGYWFPRGENIFGYCNHEVDKGELAGLATDDLRRRAAIYAKTERLIHQTVPWIPLYELRRPVVHNPDLKGFSAAPSSTAWWNAWQWDI